MLVACHLVDQQRTHLPSLKMNNNQQLRYSQEKNDTTTTAAAFPRHADGPSHGSPGVFNGRCKYKSGRCMNERTLKDNGLPHTLCEEHRVLHNKNQRKSDTKRRRLRKGVPYEPSHVFPSSTSSMHLIHHHHHHHLEDYRSTASTYSSDQEDGHMHDDLSDNDDASSDPSTPSHSSKQASPSMNWSVEEISMLHSILGIQNHPKPPASSSFDDPKRKRITGIPKFLRSLFCILEAEDPTVIGWTQDGTAIQILSERRLEAEILRKYFNHEKASSFQRQLNNFGFRKWTKTQSHTCTFSHPSFQRQHPELLAHVQRKSPRSMAAADVKEEAAANRENQRQNNTPSPLSCGGGGGMFTFDEPKIELWGKGSGEGINGGDLWDAFPLDIDATDWDIASQTYPEPTTVLYLPDDKTQHMMAPSAALDFDMSFFLHESALLH
ncbi:hypothetical protein DYB38_003337 [Aphanomyces astaci]|uniref:HSF-type DNA-binding domain-containing protein n=2 Tax=Aphanomyces astaci TaxID=112090 RepID=A0A397DMS1_APHAT|nr:hypothetical protein DYB38_003337 [Aphanomyces astaci]